MRSLEQTVADAPETRDVSASASARSEPRAGGALGAGLRITRYLVIEEIGRGGMGQVLRAYDPKLQREVALKVVRADRFDPVARRRLKREARIMAKLSHPNVVAVYDVDDDPGHGVIMAMELVVGTTLKRWRTERPREPSEVLEAFIEAGRGLAAAHRAGLLHRDFKPANVLVATDGHIKVTDFGLAKPHRSEDSIESSSGGRPSASPGGARVLTRADEAARGAELRLSGGSLTASGMVVGTPTYMAPEQHDGRPLTPAADQYAFCVALWAGLTGKSPFALICLRASKDKGPPRWPAIPGISRVVGDALRRGLSVRPSERWPDMDALLAVLSQARTRRRRRWWLGAAAMTTGIVLGGALVAPWSEGEGEGDPPPVVDPGAGCRARSHAIDAVWNYEAAQRVHEGLLGTGVSFASDTADAVISQLERQAVAWREAQAGVCFDAEVEGVWDSSMQARAEWCLDERRLELSALVEELARADSTVVEHAVTAATELSPVAICRSKRMLRSMPQLPPVGDRERLAAARAALFEARSLHAAGKYDEAIRVSRAVTQMAQSLDWSPLLANARLIEAISLKSTGDYREAERIGVEAYLEAVNSGSWFIASRAASELTCVTGMYLARPQEGRLWAKHAEAMIRHATDPMGILQLQRLNCLASIERLAGDAADAMRLYEQALDGVRDALAPNDSRIITLRTNHATMLSAQGEYEQARKLLEELLVVRESAVGPHHLSMVTGLNNLASAFVKLKRYEEAEALYERALALAERILGDSNPRLGVSLAGLALARYYQGQVGDALALGERALRIEEEALGRGSLGTVKFLRILGYLNERMNRKDRARQLYGRALRILENAETAANPLMLRATMEALSSVTSGRSRRLLDERLAALDSIEPTAPAAR